MGTDGMVLVTGANGFIGRQVCRLLRLRGHMVLAMDSSDALSSGNPSDIRTIRADICDHDAIRGVLAGHPVSTIVHLASILNTASRRNPGLATRVNIGGTVNLCEAALGAGVGRIVYGSSISVYGAGASESRLEVAEDDPAEPEDPYGASKRSAELMGQTLCRGSALQFVSLRIASVVGRGAVSTSSAWRSTIFEALDSAHPAPVSVPYGQNEALPLVHVEDVAGMIVHLVEAETVSSPIYNTPAETWTFADLAERVRSVNPRARFSFGSSPVMGIPRGIDGSRFTTEFAFRPVPLVERLVAPPPPERA